MSWHLPIYEIAESPVHEADVDSNINVDRCQDLYKEPAHLRRHQDTHQDKRDVLSPVETPSWEQAKIEAPLWMSKPEVDVYLNIKDVR